MNSLDEKLIEMVKILKSHGIEMSIGKYASPFVIFTYQGKKIFEGDVGFDTADFDKDGAIYT